MIRFQGSVRDPQHVEALFKDLWPLCTWPAKGFTGPAGWRTLLACICCFYSTYLKTIVRGMEARERDDEMIGNDAGKAEPKNGTSESGTLREVCSKRGKKKSLKPALCLTSVRGRP